MEVNIYLIKSDTNKKGKAPLKIHVGSYIKIPLGISVTVKNWNAKKQRVTTSEEFYFKINERLESKIKKINEYLKGVDNPSKKEIEALLTEKEEIVESQIEVKIELFEYLKEYQLRQKKLKSPGYVRNLGNVANHLKAFNPQLRFKDVSLVMMERFTEYLVEKVKVENATTERYLDKLKRMIRDAVKDGHLVNRSFDDHKFYAGEYDGVRLSWEEVERIEKFVPYNEEHRKIKDSFVFRCNTGLRDSDYLNINKGSFIVKDKKHYLKINSNKKEKDQLLAINSKALEIAKRYDFELPKCSQQQFNRVIKLVARAAKVNDNIERIRHRGKARIVEIKGKWDCISSHTARRTFARRWYDLGGAISLISHFLGHKTEQETRKYIGLDDDLTNAEMIRVFDQGEVFK